MKNISFDNQVNWLFLIKKILKRCINFHHLLDVINVINVIKAALSFNMTHLWRIINRWNCNQNVWNAVKSHLDYLQSLNVLLESYLMFTRNWIMEFMKANSIPCYHNILLEDDVNFSVDVYIFHCLGLLGDADWATPTRRRNNWATG